MATSMRTDGSILATSDIRQLAHDELRELLDGPSNTSTSMTLDSF